MADNIREILDGIQTLGSNESALFSIDTAPWGGSPSGPTHDIFDEEDYTTSLKTANMDGTPTLATDVINLPALHSLVAGKIYRVFVQFTSAGNVLEGYFRVKAER